MLHKTCSEFLSTAKETTPENPLSATPSPFDYETAFLSCIILLI